MVIDLVKPTVSDQLLMLDSNEIKRAKEYFKRLVRFQNLSVKKPLKGHEGNGVHQWGSKTIWVHPIRDKGDFMTCLHEVGHSINFCSLLSGIVRSEYEAEMFAIRRARHFGIDNAFLVEYEKHAKLYVAAYLDAGFKLSKFAWSDLSLEVQEVATWLGVTQSIWDNATELPFTNKREIIVKPGTGVPLISRRNNTENELVTREYERISLEGIHSTFDSITLDLIKFNEVTV